MNESPRKWYSGLTRYHWLVFAVCTMGWMFDCLDQQLFVLARNSAVTELMKVSDASPLVTEYSGYATSLMLIGWATGGIIFGIMGDRIGRVKTMIWTILCYSVFTGLCGVSPNMETFLLFRFLTGLGVGGQFAVGVTMLAETMPQHARSRALGLLQVFASIGNITAAFIAIGLAQLTALGVLPGSTWRWMFLIGVLPAILSFVVMRYLREPEAWKHAVSEPGAKRAKAGSLRELFGTPRWRRNVIVGMLLASSGVIGLWGIAFFLVDLNQTIARQDAQKKEYEKEQGRLDRQFIGQLLTQPDRIAEVMDTVRPNDLFTADKKDQSPSRIYEAARALSEEKKTVSAETVATKLKSDNLPAEISEQTQAFMDASLTTVAASPQPFDKLLTEISARKNRLNTIAGKWGGFTSILLNFGACFGIYAFALVTDRMGRRLTFTLFFLAAFFSTVLAFLYMSTWVDILWMVPLAGFFIFALFGGYTIYFPELFPTRLRSTAVSFCYNIARYVAACGPTILGLLTNRVFGQYDEPMRYAGASMCVIFFLGAIVVWFGPETKNQPLPE